MWRILFLSVILHITQYFGVKGRPTSPEFGRWAALRAFARQHNHLSYSVYSLSKPHLAGIPSEPGFEPAFA